MRHSDRMIVRKAFEADLNELMEKYPGVALTARYASYEQFADHEPTLILDFGRGDEEELSIDFLMAQCQCFHSGE